MGRGLEPIGHIGKKEGTKIIFKESYPGGGPAKPGGGANGIPGGKPGGLKPGGGPDIPGGPNDMGGRCKEGGPTKDLDKRSWT